MVYIWNLCSWLAAPSSHVVVMFC